MILILGYSSIRDGTLRRNYSEKLSGMIRLQLYCPPLGSILSLVPHFLLSFSNHIGLHQLCFSPLLPVYFRPLQNPPHRASEMIGHLIPISPSNLWCSPRF